MSLTREQKINALFQHCEKQTHCKECVFDGVSGRWCIEDDIHSAPDILINAEYSKIAPPEPIIEEPAPVVHDVVNHPNHYCREGAMECIDEMVTLFGKEAVKHFCLCNAWKYRYRSNQKNGEEDIKKSDWYIKKYVELC